jgi:3'-5' exoribonuclease
LRDLLLHLILSHHGELEFGSPKVPLFAEALLLHHLDNLDSKMECVRGGIEKDRQVEGEWTGYISALDRTILKKEKYLAAEGPKAPSTPHVETAPAEVKAPPPKRPEPSSSPFASKLKDALTHNS